MKEKIRAILTESWDSTYSGVNLDKATDKLDEYFSSELDVQAYRIVNLKTHLQTAVEDYSIILEKCLPELKAYKDMQSNNPNKLEQLNQLIKDIEEQIDNE